VNSLGMKFVPVPGTKVLFCVSDVRVKDYEAYAAAVIGVGSSWKSPGFEQGPTHPVVNVSWEDAKAFCRWLTRKDEREGLIGESQSYRLPTDAEWSLAIGLDEPSGGTPKDKDAKIKSVYPWGTEWPPLRAAANYGSSLEVDDYQYTSPVESFRANRHGLYDMGGNVWQWCEDWYDTYQQFRVLRGASWSSYDPGFLLSSYRSISTPVIRRDNFGFRVVLVDDSSR
jgi:formylglycine-generating enzyme required for sulfatase activity